MKKLTLLTIAILFALITIAQPPQMFNYQAVVRNAAGDLVTDVTVGIQIEILEGSVSGTVIYTETHDVLTNDYGLATLAIGNGTSSDDFTTIDWGYDDYFIKVSADVDGGTDYEEMGTSQLLSVPYAMVAKKAEIADSIKNYSLSIDIDDLIIGSTTIGSATKTQILQLSNIPAGIYAVYFSSPLRNNSVSSAGINLVWAVTTNDANPSFPTAGITSAFIPASGWSANYPFGQSGFKIIELSSPGTIELKVCYYGNITSGTISVDGICSLTAIKL